MLAVAKASDLLLIVLDPAKGVEQKMKILHELHNMGVRLNREQPNISIIRKKTGGLNFTSTVPLTHLNEQMIKVILQEYRINNVDVIIRGDYSVDDFIDCIEGNRKYVDAIFVYNKIDLVSLEDVDELARRPNSVVISVNLRLNLEYLLKAIWARLNLVRIYTKKQGAAPDLENPVILTAQRRGCRIENVCDLIHREFKLDFKWAYVWGRSAKFSPQTCGLSELTRPRTRRRRRHPDLRQQEAARPQEGRGTASRGRKGVEGRQTQEKEVIVAVQI